MRSFIFYGASDDLIYVETLQGAKEVDSREYGCYDTMLAFHVSPTGDATDDQVRVEGYYGKGGFWTFSATMVGDDEDAVDISQLTFTLERDPEVSYSMRLTVGGFPDTATARFVGKSEEPDWHMPDDEDAR